MRAGTVKGDLIKEVGTKLSHKQSGLRQEEELAQGTWEQSSWEEAEERARKLSSRLIKVLQMKINI